MPRHQTAKLPRQLKWFKPGAIPSDKKFVVGILGHRESGKTTLFHDWLYHTRHCYDAGAFFTGTHDTAKLMANHFPPMFVYEGYDPDKAADFLEVAKQLTTDENMHRMLVGLDDLAFDKSIMKSATTGEIYKNGRWSGVTSFSTFHDPVDIPNDLRGQLDFLGVMHTAIPGDIKRLFQYYFGQFESLNVFSKVFKSVTKNYGVMVWKKCSTGVFEDTIQYYKVATNPRTGKPLPKPPFLIGNPIFHKISRRLERENEAAKKRKSEEEVRDINY
jgi:hypothetical protein